MPNSYFQFKKFRIDQDRCAMKVCTDACIQGALAAAEMHLKKPASLLDIGAGTGLLSLMLAQNYAFALQDAIEINVDAARQAAENIKTALFDHDIHLHQGDVRTYPFSGRYDFIISNPPFYENALKSSSISVNQAKHSSHLSYEELLNCIYKLLEPGGCCCLMIPFAFTDDLVYKAGKIGLYPYNIVRLRHTPLHDPFRSILFFKKMRKAPTLQELIIRQADGTYSAPVQQLFAPYYLNISLR